MWRHPHPAFHDRDELVSWARWQKVLRWRICTGDGSGGSPRAEKGREQGGDEEIINFSLDVLYLRCLRNIHQEMCCTVLKFREIKIKCMIEDTCLG